MRSILFSAVLAVIFSAVTPCVRAEESLPADPMKRNLIFVQGAAEREVPVNGFDLVFGFDVEKSSFDDARAEAEKILARMKKGFEPLKLPAVELIKGWDLVRQAKISLSSKGRKVSNRVTVRVKDFPAGQLHSLIAKMIDIGVQADGAVALETVRVFVTDKTETAVRQELTAEALAALEASAQKTAAAVGRKVTAPRRVFVSEGGVQPLAAGDQMYYETAVMARSAMPISIQKSFNVQAEIMDHMKFSSSVSGVYEIE